MNDILLSIESVLGSSVRSTKDERLFHCPFCHHHKPKLSINFGKRLGYWKCWVCDERGKTFAYLLSKNGYSYDEIEDLLGDNNDWTKPKHKSQEDFYKKVDGTIFGRLSLPKDFQPLSRVQPKDHYEYWNALKYVRKDRGLSKEDIYRYQIGYCESGLYKSRIIIPSYDSEMKLNYFVSRCYYDDSPIKYKNPSASRDNIIFENLINWKMPVVLVEGIFDAIAVRRNCIPLLGKVMSNKLKQTLVETKPPEVYVMLDADAQREAVRIEQYLKSFYINVKLVIPTDKDPSDLGFIKSWEAISNATKSTFVDLVGTRFKTV